MFIVEDGAEFFDEGQHLFVITGYLFPFQAGQPLQPHIEDGLGLDGRELIFFHELLFGFCGVPGSLNQFYDLIEVVDGDGQSLENMGPLLGFSELMCRTPIDHHFAMLDKVLENLFEVEDLRLVVDDGQKNNPKRFLHRGHFIELIDHHFGNLVFFQLHHNPQSLAVGLIANFRNRGDLLVFYQLSDAFNQHRLILLIGNLLNDDGFSSAIPGLLDVCFGPHQHHPAARFVGLSDACSATDQTAGGKIRTLDD